MRGWGLFFFLLFLFIIFAGTGWITFTQLRARRSGLPAPSWRSYLPFVKSGGRGGSGGGLGNVPSPRSSNPIEWIKDKINALRQRRDRTAQGHYEEAGGFSQSAYSGGSGAGAGGRRTRGMDPDEAWDTRVGNEADSYGAAGPGGYYEEQELGLAPTPGLDDPYSSRGGAALPPYGAGTDARGRSKSREPPGVMGGQQELDARYDREMGRAEGQQQRVVASNNPFSDANEAPSLRGVSPRPMVDSSVGRGGKGNGGGGSQENSPTERRSMFRESL